MQRNTVVRYMALIGIGMVMIAALPALSRADGSPCDTRLKPVKNPSIRYTQRGNRCEGFYEASVSAGEMQVVGLVQGGLDYSLTREERVTVTAPAVTDKPVNIRAQAIPKSYFYRMDAVIAPNGKLTWPIGEVLFPAKLPSRYIGVFGWIGTEENKCFVPVITRAASNPSAAHPSQIRLTLRADVKVYDVQFRTAPLIKDRCGRYGRSAATGQTAYDVGQAIVIELSPAGEPERCVEISGRNQATDRWVICLVKMRSGK